MPVPYLRVGLLNKTPSRCKTSKNNSPPNWGAVARSGTKLWWLLFPLRIPVVLFLLLDPPFSLFLAIFRLVVVHVAEHILS